ncbi:MAG: hypothetical protein ACR2HJ_05530 [Fimbriimonadales bacterium]
MTGRHEMVKHPQPRVFVLASLLASAFSAPAAFLIVLGAASASLYDGGMMAPSTGNSLERALPYAIAGAALGLILGSVLVLVKPYWYGVLFAMIPFPRPFIIALLNGNPLDMVVMILVCVAIGLIARISANAVVARYA